ncbi:MAG: response regulator [Rhodobacteraceae bacterium]|nr:response regulator [Paracoccaceae bacterium]
MTTPHFNTSRDSDVRKTIAMLEKRLVDKDRFLATICHEIRSPMNGVFGMADALLRTELDEKQKRYLTVLMDACESMLSVANQVLDITKYESGQAKLTPVDFDLTDFMSLQVASFEARAKARNLELVLETSILCDPRIHFDKFRLGQVLTNLISNALRYTDQGRIVVRAILQSTKTGAHSLMISVEDTGIGMSPEAVSGIFEAFSSANPVESAARGGTGLGLTVVRDLVRLMDGEIEVKSDLGQGSSFILDLTVSPAKDEMHKTRPMRKSMPKNLNVLLAEDNESNAFVFQVMLEETGINITHVRNGEDAVSHASEQRFDVIFMDIQMPKMNGIDATSGIRADEALAQQSPTSIIALSADVFISQSPEFRAAGFSDYLSKPVRQSELLDVLSVFDKGENFD